MSYDGPHVCSKFVASLFPLIVSFPNLLGFNLYCCAVLSPNVSKVNESSKLTKDKAGFENVERTKFIKMTPIDSGDISGSQIPKNHK